MLKEKLSEIRGVESAAVGIVDDAHRRAQERLREVEAAGLEITREAVGSAEAEADAKDKTIRADIEERVAQVDRQSRDEIEHLRAQASAKIPEAVSLILGQVTDGLMD